MTKNHTTLDTTNKNQRMVVHCLSDHHHHEEKQEENDEESCSDDQRTSSHSDLQVATAATSTSTSTCTTTTTTTTTHELAALFDDFMQYGSVGLHIVDTHTGTILWANQAELDLLGYTHAREEYIGHAITEFHADAHKIDEILRILLSGRPVVNYVAPIRCRDGHLEYLEINSSMRRTQDGAQLCRRRTTRCFSVCVTDRVLRQQAQLEALAQKREAELLRADTAKKTQFLRQLGHELRNPLSGVTGNLDLLLNELQAALADCTTTTTTTTTTSQPQPQPTTAEQRLLKIQERLTGAYEYAACAKLAAEHQTLVINDTLSLSRLESSSDFLFTFRPVDVTQLVQTDVMAILGVQAQEKQVTVHTTSSIINNHHHPEEEKDDRSVMVKTDVVWLKQIVINLLSNAIKFTEPHGHVNVTIAAYKDDDDDDDNEPNAASTTTNLVITVQDTGIGMSPAEQGKLFGEFCQANQAISARFGGSGLGLHIVKQVLDRLGGTLQVTSTKGVGSTFVVTLPCETLSDEELCSFPTATTTTTPQVSTRPSPPQETTTTTLPSTLGKKIQVLVVDDIAMNRKVLASYLRRRGYAYQVAENGKVALEMHLQSRFDIILTDIDMPVMNGLELTEKIRQAEQQQRDRFATTTRPVPIIGISGNVFPQDVVAAKRVGIDTYIAKPFKFPDLEATMRQALAPS